MDISKMTVEQLIESGAEININFNENTRDKALERIESFDTPFVFEEKMYKNAGVFILGSRTMLEISAFYEEDNNE